MSNETFNVTPTSKTNFLFTSVEKKDSLSKIKIKIIEELKGGKSGDPVYKIKFKGKEAILKLLKDKEEIDNHLLFSSFYKNSEYKPFPIIYYYGLLNGSFGDNKFYIIMEMIESYEFDDYISSICKEEIKVDHAELLNIILQLLYIIGIAQLYSLSHCDLHTKNIMLVKNNNKLKKISLFNVIGENKDIVLGTYIVKILDFGLTSRFCKKIRTTSQTLNSLKTLCGSYPNLIDLIKGEIGIESDYKNVDINFLCRIIEIVMLFDKELKNINISYLWRQSLHMYQIEISNMDDITKKKYKQKIFRHLYYEII